jgi:hypothetical protein
MVQNLRAIPCKTHRVSRVPLTVTLSLYGGDGFLAIDAAPRGLYYLEAVFEHGTVGAFLFEPVDRAAVTSRSITMAYSLLMSTGKRV